MAGTEEISEAITKFIKDNDLLIDPIRLSFIEHKRISIGGSSVVKKGRYDGNLVAIKTMEPKVIGSPVNRELLSKFAIEVHLLNLVRHENVIKLIGASMEPELRIVTEFMKGGSLKAYLMEMQPDPPELRQSISFALDLSRAMEHLHANNIIHRDIKPGNLLLTEDHKSLKVADFGLAQLGVDQGYLKKKLGVQGTLYEPQNNRWMAPEIYEMLAQYRTPDDQPGQKPGDKTGKKTGDETGKVTTGDATGKKAGDETGKVTGEKRKLITCDHKVDVYSFSMVLWELLTNKTPPTKGNPAVEELPDSVPGDVANLLKTCWEKEPTKRPEFATITVQLSDVLKTLPA